MASALQAETTGVRIPDRRLNYRHLAQWLAHRSDKAEVPGSSPGLPTMRFLQQFTTPLLRKRKESRLCRSSKDGVCN